MLVVASAETLNNSPAPQYQQPEHKHVYTQTKDDALTNFFAAYGMTLHIISQSPFENQAFSDCLEVIHIDRDDVLLLADGTNTSCLITTRHYDPLNHNITTHNTIRQLYDNAKIYAIKEDLKLRGLHELIPKEHTLQLISYSGFVKLTEKHNNICTWY